MKKSKRKVHINNQEWNYWVGSGRFKEVTHVTISSPKKEFYKIDSKEGLSEICESEMYVGIEGALPTGVTPSKVKEYIKKHIKWEE